MKKKFIILLIVAVFLTITFLIYKSISTAKVPTVTIVKPENRIIKSTISSTGKVLSKKSSSLSFSTSGIITNIYAKEGVVVKKGQILAKLNTYTATQTSKVAKDQRDIAIRNKDLFLEKYQNNKDAIGGKDQFNIKVRTLNEQISLAEANFKASIGQVSNYYIKAPFDGTIVSLNSELGEVVVPTQQIYKIADLENLYFETDIDQEDFGKIKVGQKANIILDAYPDQPLSANVYELNSYANQNETFTIKLSFDNNQNIKPLIGMTGDLKLITKKTKDKVQSLAFDEYFKDINGNFIWTIDKNSQLKKIPIETGLEGDIYTEIITDLSEYKIVLPNSTKIELTEGLTVRVLK